MYKILIVEDDMTIAQAIKKHLESWGWEAKCLTDFNNVLSDFAAYNPQLVLLDISLPFYNGYHWCSQIRKVSQVPVIFISSLSDNMNIVLAMNMGGDDFVAKPFDLGVLTAKIQAIFRRTYDFGGQSNIMECEGAILNLNDCSLSFKEHKISLSRNDHKILQTLLENKGKIVSRDTLMLKLWETHSFVDENTLTVNITRLRRKLEAIGLNDFIKTKKGIGYIIN